MFDSLEEQMKSDDRRMVSPRERMLRWAIIAVAALVVFGGVLLGVHFMS